MKPTNMKWLPIIAGSLVLIASQGHAAVTLNNGSFETTVTLYLAALGDLYEASGWTNLSPTTNFQASSAVAANPPNGEFTSAAGTATGSRYLRLVNDVGNQGILAQNLGTMVAGETYMITADIFGGAGVNVNYGATISLVNQVSATPSTTYASQTITDVADTAFMAGAFNFSYTATALDDGNPLVLLLAAGPAGAGQANRGGIDNVQLTVIPEPCAALLGGLGMIALVLRRRQDG
jgi:hypothetical protein